MDLMTRTSLASSMLMSALALGPACVPDKDPGDSATAFTTEPGTTNTTEPTAGPEALCPGNPNFSCTVPFNCTDFPCGGLQDRHDADGCPRLGCGGDKICPEGQVCYQTGAWGECNASSIDCEDVDGQCQCNLTLDCQDVAYCVPAELGPPTDCSLITDANACLAAGCSDAPPVVPMVLEADGCTCGATRTECLWFASDDIGSTASPAPYYRKSTLEVVMFPGDWFDAPHGWAPCEGDPAAPAACACACAP